MAIPNRGFRCNFLIPHFPDKNLLPALHDLTFIETFREWNAGGFMNADSTGSPLAGM